MQRFHIVFLFALLIVTTAAHSEQPASAAPQSASAPKLPQLTLTKQFAGPLEDTAIQRFVDQDTGVVCYLYTPYVVNRDRDSAGRIVYGANNIGSISCVAPWKSAGR